ncbi:hypothetical protein KC19_7G032400 [Ceratodon purpureus]|uniref:AAA+ ATPase domain-containing protein n=1 Tax=Ceratodon purpureus TaxID=3225 RepID=A0A8T0H6L3_CERPU|nr:hypothetical protein KC19_7G032400 [Ceratodon purpureus]
MESDKLWESRSWEINWGTFMYFVGQEIMCSLIGRCVFWLIIFYGFYCCNLFFQERQREERQNKLSKAHRAQSDSERAAVDHHWPWPEIQSHGNSVLDLPDVPRRRRTRFTNQPLVNPGPNATRATYSSSGLESEAIPRLAPVMMFTPWCTKESCKENLKKHASDLCAPYQDITCLEASGWFVQTQLDLSSAMAKKLKRIAAERFCSIISVQLSRWRACCLIDGEVKTLKLNENETDLVPVILHSSYAAGILTVEGLNLNSATIQLVSKHGGCTTLETKRSEGAGGLEIHTCMCELPKKHSVPELSILAFTEVVKDGIGLRVSSLSVQIQDNNLRTVLRDILPFTFLVTYATKQILLSVMYASPIVAGLILFLIITSAQMLPQSIETTIKLLLTKMTTHVSLTFYYAFQTFMFEFKTYVSSMKFAEDAAFPSRKNSKTPSSRKASSHPIVESESFSLEASDIEEENSAPAHGSDPVQSSEWQWPVYDTIYKYGVSSLKLRKVENAETTVVPFEVVYLNREGLPWANQVKVNISSPYLIELLSGKIDQWGCKKKISIDGPELFRSYEKLTETREVCEVKLKGSESSSSADGSPDKEELQHITHLIRFMDKEFEEINLLLADMKNGSCVTWEMLWAFFPPEERVVYFDVITQESVCGEVLHTKYKESSLMEDAALFVTVKKWDYNCKSWKECTNTIKVRAFEGDLAINTLDIHPLKFAEDIKATEKMFLDIGEKFCALSMMQRNLYMNYTGTMVKNDKKLFSSTEKQFAEGRVMIDLRSFSKMNPDYPMGSAQPPIDVLRDNISVQIDITTDPKRMYCPSFVYGFSFRLKKWGCFSVRGFSDIEYNDSAYDELVMNPVTKSLTESWVREHLKEGRNEASQGIDRIDPIANKGEGCIFLCYGPPGTGKTFTAESLSEKLQCPLWTLSAFELGTTPQAVETMLVKVLDIAASWGAILLLDEADVYLERRSSKDLTRNAITGVFLRQLEYYRGVLFLTTNRDDSFDEAICSRITQFLYYGRLDEHQRGTIWTNLFSRGGLKKYTTDDLAELSKPEFNGREIRKIVKIAQTMANIKKEKLKVQHVREALTVYDESSKFRTALHLQTHPNHPVHQHPTHTPSKLQKESPKSACAAPTPSEIHPSSSATFVGDCPSGSEVSPSVCEGLDPHGTVEQQDST